VQRASGIPCALCILEGGLLPTPRAKSRRENAEVWRHEQRLELICRPGAGLAQAGTHSRRTKFCQSRPPSFLYPRTPVVMDPGVRRDDEKAGAAEVEPLGHPS
jgi:hypothetical protein